MNRGFTLLVVVAFLASLAVVWWVQRDGGEPVDVGEPTATPTPEPLYELTAADIQEVAVVGATGSYTLTRVAGGWEVDGSETNDQVEGVVEGLSAPTIKGEVPAGLGTDVYGFATPSLTVTLRTAGGEEDVTLQVGDEVPLSSDYYIRLQDEERMVWISGLDLNRLKDWIETPPLAPTPTPEASATPEEDEILGPEVEDEGSVQEEDALDEEPTDEAGASETDEASEAGEDDTEEAPTEENGDEATEQATEAAPSATQEP